MTGQHEPLWKPEVKKISFLTMCSLHYT